MPGKPTPQPKGIDWKNVSFVVGHRADLMPDAMQRTALFARECEQCRTKAFTEVAYPLDVPVVCNVCVSRITAQIEQSPSTLLLYDLPIAVKIRLLETAQERGLPVEEVIKQFAEWKLGRPIKATFNRPPQQSKTKK